MQTIIKHNNSNINLSEGRISCRTLLRWNIAVNAPRGTSRVHRDGEEMIHRSQEKNNCQGYDIQSLPKNIAEVTSEKDRL